MNKVFLLLRQNTQSGPYTFDELLQQNLQPTDLIWMEGNGANWFNPDDLWQYLKKNPQQLAGKTVKNGEGETPTVKPAATQATAVNLTPEMELEKRVEEIRKRALEYAAHTPTPVTRVEHTSSRSRTIHIADENIEFTHHRRSRAVTVPQLLVACTFGLILVGIVYMGWSPINAKKHETSGVAIPVGATIVQEPQPEAVPAVALEESTSTNDALIVDPVFAETPAAQAPLPKKENEKKQIKEKTPPAIAEVKETPPVKEEPIVTTAAIPATTTEATPKAETKKETAEETSTPEVSEKKKTFGQVLKGIFKKKNRGEAKEEAAAEN